MDNIIMSGCSLLLLILLSSPLDVVQCAYPSSLFVFGDSYADTGNTPHDTFPWKFPYGIRSGKPSGRLSDGKILTDFVASFYNLPTPVPYTSRNQAGTSVKYGMNFARAGAGVIESAFGAPTTQIQIANGLFGVISQNVYSRQDFSNAIVLYSISGNDYGTYYTRDVTLQFVSEYTQLLVKRILSDLKALYDVGFRRFAVLKLGPIGCLPVFTEQSSYKTCNETVNKAAFDHNTLLQTDMKSFGDENPDAKLTLLDQYYAVTSILKNPGEIKDPLRPCCAGACGFNAANSMALYSVCDHSDSTFIWDAFHLTEYGWSSIIPTFNTSLSSLLV